MTTRLHARLPLLKILAPSPASAPAQPQLVQRTALINCIMRDMTGAVAGAGLGWGG